MQSSQAFEDMLPQTKIKVPRQDSEESQTKTLQQVGQVKGDTSRSGGYQNVWGVAGQGGWPVSDGLPCSVQRWMPPGVGLWLFVVCQAEWPNMVVRLARRAKAEHGRSWRGICINEYM